MEILHSKIEGQGAPLLILHGYFGMGDNWKTLGAQFAEHYEVHLVDQRNHGRSFHADAFSYEVMVEDVKHYMDAHHLNTCALLGHSMGGKTAMLFAVTYPERVTKLLVADIAPKAYAPHHHEILAALNSVDFTVQDSRKKVEEKLAELIPEFGVRQFLMKNTYWKEKGQLAFRFNLESLTKNNPEVGKALPEDTSFSGPTLFLSGGNSGYITSQEHPLIAKHFPQSSIETIPNTGHWLHAEQPKVFYSKALDFLKS